MDVFILVDLADVKSTSSASSTRDFEEFIASYLILVSVDVLL